MATAQNGTPARRRLASIPHKRVSDFRVVDVPARGGVAAHKDHLVTTACGQEKLTTLVTGDDSRVRCTGCIAATAGFQAVYEPGDSIEYTSFDPSGYSPGRVVRYAPADEQTRICPNCSQLAVPRSGPEDGRWPALGDPLVYIRSRSGGKPVPVRESQLRRHDATGG